MRGRRRTSFGRRSWAGPVISHPILNIEVEVPEDVLNIITKVKGQVHGMEQSGLLTKVRGEILVLETFELSDNPRDAT